MWVRALGLRPITRDVGVRQEGKPLYAVDPRAGKFFEYCMRPGDLGDAMEQVGLRVIEIKPIQLPDGLFHEFGNPKTKFSQGNMFAKFDRTTCTVRLRVLGRILNRILSVIPYGHNHMCLCVGEKTAPA
jgi:hypothetical protein